jgi:hypothetical protein
MIGGLLIGNLSAFSKKGGQELVAIFWRIRKPHTHTAIID